MKKIALITGITGQDGSYLCEFLIEKGYKIYGIVRRNSCVFNYKNIDHIKDKLNLRYGDLTDGSSLFSVISEIINTNKEFIFLEIYNLAAQSHVRLSFDMPAFTAQVNAIGALNVFDSVKDICPDAKVYQASSSEMFGSSVDEDNFQRETTPMTPVSPYGCSKLYAYSIARNFRKAYGLFISNGILFNHESPRRGTNFVTAKVIKGALNIKKGYTDKLEMGNLDSYRDWGHSSDYTKAMIKLLNYEHPEDIVISTGKAHSVRELCEVVFNELGLDYKDHIVINKRFFRPQELSYLQGDSSKGRKMLNF